MGERKDERAERLAAQLRANLHRRKALQRERAAPPQRGTTSEPTE
jgi:hypothetical protein